MNKPIMKTKEEIEQLAEQYTQDGIYLSDSEKQQTEIAYMTGYTQCQVHGEDMADAKGEPLYYVEDLSDWDGTLNDGLEDEPFISDDFQIGPDGAYEHIEENKIMTPKEKAIELVEKYENECLLSIDGGKVAAVIAVDEIINHHSQEQGLYIIDTYYWREVKKEIENL